ncbi:S8 family serine peptidase [Psychroserpens sp. MEBiC05023]
MKFLLIIGLIVTLLSCNSQKKASIEKSKYTIEHSIQKDDYIKGELIVLFSDKEDFKRTIETLKAYKNVELISILSEMKDAKIAHFIVSIGQEQEYIKIFQKHPNVKVAELNLVESFD